MSYVYLHAGLAYTCMRIFGMQMFAKHANGNPQGWREAVVQADWLVCAAK